MKIQLDATATEWQAKARQFAERELIPHEVEAEMNGGRLPAEVGKRHREMAVELGFSAMDVPRQYGGLELRTVDQVAVWEQLGRVTNALCWCFSEPQRWMFEACREAQLEAYVLPLMQGTRKECYAITERESGSDVVIETTAEVAGDRYRINGEKWYVTSANLADFMFVQARLASGPHAGSEALFLVDRASPGIEVLRTPLFSHTFDHHHPQLQFTDVEVPAENRIGAEGEGMAYTHSWFRRERLMIAARDCGAATRLIEEATEFAQQRRVSGERLIDKQLVQAMLADSVTELWAARLITFEAAHAHDRGENVKSLHARCSIAKLYASEAASRIADRAVQIFGGRGYMRENCAERFTREIRVDRIWEGASELQRLVIARALDKRGLEEL
ncbi:MAG: acyl-CoA dehydrogenase [Xanthomonadales bacterium]|nr:acyl-CoA dehydrogenase [Xanthomonadales bacterium]NIN58572.1 acyl-CoA dehydrogenase [Xanthomonadales bacterium]NIN73861.1 acyl-CoA dehydrogenase [Xanthomonadales bacterium]NIO12330.1 acyl-CoA dehydrogenase [Xanthomonadales bacterium]NIP10965.1 acyl-CoA dehydrogenase [Xanthomonadales bacterium]